MKAVAGKLKRHGLEDDSGNLKEFIIIIPHADSLDITVTAALWSPPSRTKKDGKMSSGDAICQKVAKIMPKSKPKSVFRIGQNGPDKNSEIFEIWILVLCEGHLHYPTPDLRLSRSRRWSLTRIRFEFWAQLEAPVKTKISINANPGPAPSVLERDSDEKESLLQLEADTWSWYRTLAYMPGPVFCFFEFPLSFDLILLSSLSFVYCFCLASNEIRLTVNEHSSHTLAHAHRHPFQVHYLSESWVMHLS